MIPKASCHMMIDDAQNINERTITFVKPETLDIFAYQNAWSSIQIFRNKYLVPGIMTAEDFQYATPKIKFYDPIVPLLKYDSFDMKGLCAEPKDLAGYLSEFFKLLFKDAPGEEVVVKMECTFSYSLVPDLKDMPRIKLPVKLLAPTPYTIEADKQPDFVLSLSKVVEQWKAAQNPVINESSQLNFSLEVFAGNNSLRQMPLFSLGNLYISIYDLE